MTGGCLGRHLEYWIYARFAKVAKVDLKTTDQDEQFDT